MLCNCSKHFDRKCCKALDLLLQYIDFFSNMNLCCLLYSGVSFLTLLSMNFASKTSGYRGCIKPATSKTVDNLNHPNGKLAATTVCSPYKWFLTSSELNLAGSSQASLSSIILFLPLWNWYISSWKKSSSSLSGWGSLEYALSSSMSNVSTAMVFLAFLKRSK